jgi:hypothetical protein
MGAKTEIKNDKKKTPFTYVKNKVALAKLKSIVPKPRSQAVSPGSSLRLAFPVQEVPP